LTFEWAFHWGLRQGPINVEDSDAETFGCKDWLVHDNEILFYIFIGVIIVVGFMIGIFGIIIVVFIVVIAHTTTAITNGTVIGRR
jgi:hypothetical protein